MINDIKQCITQKSQQRQHNIIMSITLIIFLVVLALFTYRCVISPNKAQTFLYGYQNNTSIGLHYLDNPSTNSYIDA